MNKELDEQSKMQIERVLGLITQLNLSQRDFCDNLDISPALPSQWKNGRQAISKDVITKIHHRFGVKYEWLIDGIGEMWEEGRTPTLISIPQPESKQTIENSSVYTIGNSDNIQKEDRKKSETNESQNAEAQELETAQQRANNAPLSSTKIEDFVSKNTTKKEVKKIIVLFTDNTFSEYELKKI